MGSSGTESALKGMGNDVNLCQFSFGSGRESGGMGGIRGLLE
jgi:hypothetical protein